MYADEANGSDTNQKVANQSAWLSPSGICASKERKRETELAYSNIETLKVSGKTERSEERRVGKECRL